MGMGIGGLSETAVRRVRNAMIFKETAVAREMIQALDSEPAKKTPKKKKRKVNSRRKEFRTCKPSRLCEIAMEDLLKIEKMDHLYKIEMAEWHSPVFDEDDDNHRKVANIHTCYVCYAGATMAMSLDLKPNQDYAQTKFPEGIERRLSALNAFRSGYIHDGLEYMGFTLHQSLNAKDVFGYYNAPELLPEYESLPNSIPVPCYNDDKRAFKRGMKRVIKLLQQHGL
jgi:hypothetical protein